MLKSTTVKIDTLISNYLNGNRKDAARQVRALTRVEIAELLVEHYQTNAGIAFIGKPDERYGFEQFVIRALRGWAE